MNKTVCMDVDGVLADFEGAFCEKFGWENRQFASLEKRYPEKADDIGLFVLVSKTYESLDIIPVGVEITRFLADRGFDIHIVSSRPEYCKQATVSWLKRNKIPFHFMSVGVQQKSLRYMSLCPVMVFEDMLDIAQAMARFGVHSFLIDQPWNFALDSYGVRRIRTFEKFLLDFNEIYETLSIF